MLSCLTACWHFTDCVVMMIDESGIRWRYIPSPHFPAISWSILRQALMMKIYFIGLKPSYIDRSASIETIKTLIIISSLCSVNPSLSRFLEGLIPSGYDPVYAPLLPASSLEPLHSFSDMIDGRFHSRIDDQLVLNKH